MQQAQNLFVEAFGRERHRNFVDVADIRRGNHARFGDVAEERDFGLEVGAQLAVAAANQNVRLDSDAEHFLHAVLRGLGLQLAGRGDKWHEREVRENHVLGAEFEAHLADRFHKRQRFDVADRAADFHDDDVHAVGHFPERGLDFVGDVRNHLHGLAEIVAAAFFRDDRFVDAAGGPVMVAGEMRGGEALVVAEVEIGFRAVVRDKHFAVLIGRHCPGINVQVGIALLEGDFQAAAFKQASNRRRRYALSKRGNYAARHKDVLRAGPQALDFLRRSRRTTDYVRKARACQITFCDRKFERATKFQCAS